MSNREAMRAAVKTLHQKRRAAGKCIYDNSDRTGATPHGAPHKGGRCEACWSKKLKSAAKPKIAVACASCSAPAVRRGAKFCAECGAALTPPAAVSIHARARGGKRAA